MPVVIPTSTREVSGSPATVAALVNATVGSFVGFSNAVVSLVQVAILASMMGVSGSLVTAAALTSATVGPFVGFSDAAMTDRRMGVVTHIPKAGDVNADASYNSFSPLSGLGSRDDLCFGERDDFMVDSSEKGGEWSNTDVEPVVSSQVGGFDLLQDGPEHLLS